MMIPNKLEKIDILNVESFFDFEHVSVPTKKDEWFQRFPLEKILNKEYEAIIPHTVLNLPHEYHDEDFYYIYVIDNQFIVHPKELDEYIEFKTAFTPPAKEWFSLLAQLYITQFNHLYIKKTLDKPVVLIHIFSKSNHFYPNSLDIHLEKEAKASIIDVFIADCKNSFVNYNRNFHLDVKAKLDYYKRSFFKNNALVLNNTLKLEEKSRLKAFCFDKSSPFILNHWTTVLSKQKSKFKYYALINAKKQSFIANVLHTYHQNEHTTSDIHIKHILKENATASFQALSLVEKEALYAKAFQNSDTVLLSDDATIYAKPHLEILTDELQASHGATTGSLNEDQLLYLKSRGIDEEKAKAMLLKAFGATIYDKISSEKIKAFILNLKRSSYV